MKRIAAITTAESDVTRVLEASGYELRLVRPDEVTAHDLDTFDAIAILGGVEAEPMLFHPEARKAVDRQIEAGKRVFCEYVSSIADIYFTGPETVRRKRLVWSAGAAPEAGIVHGSLLDAQSNQFLPPFRVNGIGGLMLLYARTPPAHDTAEIPKDAGKEVSSWALWFDRPNLLVCTIRMAWFNAARFAPRATWQRLMRFVLEWLCGNESIRADCLEPVARFEPVSPGEALDPRLLMGMRRAVRWFERAGMLLGNGTRGVKEGAAAAIRPDGRQEVLSGVRTDCVSEAGLLYYMDHLVTGSPVSLRTSDNLHDFCFANLQAREGDRFQGMLRWGEGGWSVCYQDDAARVMIPVLLKNLYGRPGYHLAGCVESLRFLLATTGTDGTRVMRTDANALTRADMETLASTPGKLPSAHYNGFYLGSLALAAAVCRRHPAAAVTAGADPAFIERSVGVAEKGLGTIMGVYPETRREHSETQELCRLVAPLAWLFWATGKAEHREWLYRVARDLQRFRHSSGGYAEWDTGYTAACARNENGECSLLANNGDPVADLLYSLNWLPIGLMQAHFITRDDWFLELWRGIARFMLSVQIASRDPLIDGGWARALDMERMEVFAVPFDVGWGPWSIESGWTVGEIGSGLAMGLLAERLAPTYD